MALSDDIDIPSTIVVNTTELQLLLDAKFALLLAVLEDYETRIAALEP